MDQIRTQRPFIMTIPSPNGAAAATIAVDTRFDSAPAAIVEASRTSALLRLNPHPCALCMIAFLLLLAGRGWKTRDGTIEYEYIAGGIPPTREDLAARAGGRRDFNFPTCLRVASRQGDYRHLLSKHPLCLRPGSGGDNGGGPPVWSHEGVVANHQDSVEYTQHSPPNTRTPHFRNVGVKSDTLYLLWSSDESEWRMWFWNLDESYAWYYKKPVRRVPTESSVPSGDGWLSSYETGRRYMNGVNEVKFKEDWTFSIEPCRAAKGETAGSPRHDVPKECYDYVVTSYPVYFTYWPGLIFLVLGVCVSCLSFCMRVRDDRIDETSLQKHTNM